ncbi:hypothetical protein TELCIR_08383 [Teladorsagia circumcincta]|uniref:Glycosyltransferase family 92 protein n=1 Tax=Teladorsagia circumcincta TaxID=45464 RepID=A0A2G9UHR8_TELCI|nr:hypothetical protein TELCIR_08383 [Teladorsagia circumcincta]
MEIALTAEGSEEYFNFMVKDVSLGENHVYEHAVGVCVQPVFYLADWPLVIQFFESWLAQGATKFYFYYHSYTAQVQAVLEFYKRKLGRDLELIGWSDLPVQERDRGSYTKDPNSRIQWNSLQTPSDIRFMLSASKLVADRSVRYDYRVSKKMFTRPERCSEYVLGLFLCTDSVCFDKQDVSPLFTGCHNM